MSEIGAGASAAATDDIDSLFASRGGDVSENPDQQRHYRLDPLDPSRPAVLIVDDSEMMRHLVANVVEQVGAQPVEAEDGAQGLTLARHYRPAVIVLDVHMATGGLQVLRELRTDARIGSTPVIMLTVDASRAVIREALDWKVDDYMLKPPSLKDLARRLNRHLQGWH